MRKYGRLWIILILSILTLFGLIRLGNIDISLATLNQIGWGWFLLVLISFYASVLARGWRWKHILTSMGRPVGSVYAITLLTAGLFTSAILPARAGDVARVVMLKQDQHIPVPEGIASIAAERALDVLAILGLALIGAWWALSGHIPSEILQFMTTIAILFCLGLIGLLALPGTEGWLRENKFLSKLLSEKLWSFYQKILDFCFSLLGAIRALGNHPKALTLIIIESFMIWLYDALMVYFALLSIGSAIPFSASLFTAMISDLVTAIPLTPGSLGQFDAAMVALLALFGVSTAHAALATLIIRIVGLWTFIPVSGLVTYLFGFSRVLKLSYPSGPSGQSSPMTASPSSNLAES